MKPTLHFAIFCTTVLLAVPACGQHMNEKDSACANVVVTVELTNCFSDARNRSDTKLNSVYKEIRTRLEGADADHLTKTQRLWVQYRDANCSSERDLYEGGTAKYAVYFACLESLTRARTRNYKLPTLCD
jgi:uncharacterized protein YecT (DUF1311 family)